jgi:hypothetical protein
MKIHLFSAMIVSMAISGAALAQDTGSAPGPGQRVGRGNGGAMIGRGLMGTVTEAGAGHFTIKTDQGDIYSVQLNSGTRIFKRQSGGFGVDGQGAGAGQGPGEGRGGGRGYGRGNPPLEISATDIKTGDVIEVMGDTDAAAKSVNARAVALLDQQAVEQIRRMEADFGKTWLMGTITAIDGTKITLTGTLDNTPHTVAADENTEFRERREPITLADIHLGDTVRVEGAVKDGVFVAASVNVARMGGETPTVPRNSPPR